MVQKPILHYSFLVCTFSSFCLFVYLYILPLPSFHNLILTFNLFKSTVLNIQIWYFIMSPYFKYLYHMAHIPFVISIRWLGQWRCVNSIMGDWKHWAYHLCWAVNLKIFSDFVCLQHFFSHLTLVTSRLPTEKMDFITRFVCLFSKWRHMLVTLKYIFALAPSFIFRIANSFFRQK